MAQSQIQKKKAHSKYTGSQESLLMYRIQVKNSQNKDKKYIIKSFSYWGYHYRLR